MSAKHSRQDRVYRGFLIAVGGLMIAAAGLKGHQIAYHGMSADSLLTSTPRPLLLIVCEFLVGLWLVSGLYQRAARLVAMLCFFGFMEVALWRAINGQTSCGCFGQLVVSPGVAFAVDLAISVGFVLSSLTSSDRTLPAYKLRFFAFLFVALAVGIPGFVTVAVYRREAARTFELRHDKLLHDTKIAVELPQPTANELLLLVAAKLGTGVSVEDALREQFDACPLAWKSINHHTHRGWAVLEAIPKCMPVPSRWLRTQEGYVLVGDSPLQRAKAYWLAGLIFGVSGLGWLARHAWHEKRRGAYPHTSQISRSGKSTSEPQSNGDISPC